MKRVLIYDPYFDTLGGGEKYTAGVMEAFSLAGYEVVIAWNDICLPTKICDRFGMDLKVQVDPVSYELLRNGNLMQKYVMMSAFDCVFWISDGSIPFLFGKQNILHFQVPFTGVKKSFFNPLKWHLISHIICNSAFTKQVIDKTYGVDSIVIYPPCSEITPKKKEKIILSVGRFDGLLHSKRQDILINAFKRLKLSGWKLILAGGDMGQTNALSFLRQQAQGSSIEFMVNPDYSTIKKLYGEASLFWHAAGFGVDEEKEPQKVEHFGIATVEAMTAGAVPLVYRAGGQPEIVCQEENGFLWTTVDELIEKSQLLINDTQLLEKVAAAALETSKQFSMERFIHDFTDTCIR